MGVLSGRQQEERGQRLPLGFTCSSPTWGPTRTNLRWRPSKRSSTPWSRAHPKRAMTDLWPCLDPRAPHGSTSSTDIVFLLLGARASHGGTGDSVRLVVDA